MSSSSKSTLRGAMLGCAKGLAITLLGIGLLIGFGFVAPHIWSIAAPFFGFFWYGWVKLITANYTNVVPSLVIEVPALLLTAWMTCVSYKYEPDGPSYVPLRFGLTALGVLLFVAAPTNCALFATIQAFPEWTSEPVERVAVAISLIAIPGMFGMGVYGLRQILILIDDAPKRRRAR